MMCFCYFVFYVLPKDSFVYINCGFIPSAVWRLSNIHPQRDIQGPSAPLGCWLPGGVGARGHCEASAQRNHFYVTLMVPAGLVPPGVTSNDSKGSLI